MALTPDPSADTLDIEVAQPPHIVAGCEGFQVRSVNGHLGFIERIHPDARSGLPAWLAVRAGRIIVLLVPVEDIVGVDPEERVVSVGAYVGQHVSHFAAERIFLQPAS